MIAHPHYLTRFPKRKYRAAFSCHQHALQMLLLSNVTFKLTACFSAIRAPRKFPMTNIGSVRYKAVNSAFV